MEFIENQPIYMQIADHFCENILLGKWQADEKIPSVREIAVLLEVNPNTAMRAYSYLQDLGIIYNKRGIGYFVAEDSKKNVQIMKRKEFIEVEVPGFFKKMQMLGFTYSDLKNLFGKDLKQHKEND